MIGFVLSASEILLARSGGCQELLLNGVYSKELIQTDHFVLQTLHQFNAKECTQIHTS